MEDYIYILIGVIWLAASVYRAAQKNKKQGSPQKPANKESSPQPRMSKARSLLEELLEGQEVSIPEPEVRDISYDEPEPVADKADKPAYIFQSEYSKMGLRGLESITEEGSRSTDRILFVDEMKNVGTKGGGQRKINLRKAIIYKAILERPYT